MASEELNALMTAIRSYDGGEPDAVLIEASRAFLGVALEAPSLLLDAAQSMSALPPARAGWIALLLGNAVEHGVDAGRTMPALWGLLMSWVDELPLTGDDVAPDDKADRDVPELTPRQFELVEALPSVCPAVVSHLARLPQQREAWAQDAALLSRLEAMLDHTYAVEWVRTALMCSSGSLVLLHVPSGQGALLRYQNVVNCFHLFTLVQAAIGERLPGGREPNAALADAARGRAELVANDAAWWHYGNPRSPVSDIGSSIWGEANVRAVPSFDEHRVILLWPPVLSGRSWDTGFSSPHLQQLPADAQLERMLSPDECRQWLDRLGVARAER